MKVRLVFYRAGLNWTDILISGWTWIWNPFTNPYSHVEIGFCVSGEWTYFSSSTRNTFLGAKIKNGTRWISEKILLKNRDRWDIYECEYSKEEVKEMIDRAGDIIGKPYDFWGILGFITITGQLINSISKWYCSEAVFYVLSGVWVKRISPRRLSTRVIAIGFKLCGD